MEVAMRFLVILFMLVGCGSKSSSGEAPPPPATEAKGGETVAETKEMPADSGFNQDASKPKIADTVPVIPPASKPPEPPAAEATPTYDAALVSQRVAEVDAAIKAEVDELKTWKIGDDWLTYSVEKRDLMSKPFVWPASYLINQTDFITTNYTNYSPWDSGYQCDEPISYAVQGAWTIFRNRSVSSIYVVVNTFPKNGKLYVTKVDIKWRLSSDTADQTYKVEAACAP